MDRVLGTDYEYTYGKSRSKINTMLKDMTKLAASYCLGVLVIDEFQNLKLAKRGESHKTLDFLYSLITGLGVPMILIGTDDSSTTLTGRFIGWRKSDGHDDLEWPRLLKGSTWEEFLNGIWNYQWTDEEIPLTEELSDILYEESQGIVDIAVKLYAFAQWEIIAAGKGGITPELIKEIVDTKFQLVKPMLETLKSVGSKKIS